MNIVKLICNFKKNNSMLWVEANNIKLFVADDFEDQDKMIEIIKKCKPEILEFLVSNKIFSKEAFQKKTIFKSNDNEAPLSFAQRRLWFIHLYEQGSNAYHIPLEIGLDAGTDTEGIKYAMQQIVARHEVLRSTIEHGDNKEYGIQRVHNEPLFIEDKTVSGEEEFRSVIREDINRPFDLSYEYPIRIILYTIEADDIVTEELPNRNALLINFNHIASDGWSIEIFEREWAAYYEAYMNNDLDFSLPPLEIQYKDYAVWQRAYLSGEVLDKQLRYWKEKLAGYQPLELFTDYPRPAGIDYSGAHRTFSLDEETSEKIRVLARHYGVTIHIMMLGSIHVLLSKYTGQEDIVTGSVIANRHHRQTEDIIGFFVNTQVNRTLLNRHQSFADLIKQVQQDQTDAQSYQDLPFEKLVEELGVERDPSRHPVFQVMFGIEDFSSPLTTDEQKNNQKPQPTDITYEMEKFDLSINIFDGAPAISGQISYATSLFKQDTIDRFIDHHKRLLKQLIAFPEQPYSQLSLLNAEEYKTIVYEWNDTKSDYPDQVTIHQFFQEQAEKTPDNIALIYEGLKLTYRELNEKSNQLARHIREQYSLRTKKPIVPGTLIALHLDRSLEMIIGILGVLKAGAAYVPMDITYPQERTNFILEDIKGELVLCQRHHPGDHATQLPHEKILYIDLAEKFFKDQDPSNLPEHCNATDLAYLIYTSGSTDRPKAVAIEHRSVVNMAVSRVVEYEMSGCENSLQIASVCFDASVEQIFVALFSGATLTLITKEVLADGKQCELFINANRITHLDTVPSFLETLDFSKLKYLKRIASGGEACSVELVNKILPYIDFYNEYGPTEATVIATQHKIAKGTKLSEKIPIGKPISNTKIFILDKYLNVVPVQIEGEIYIGGECLARGYLNSETLTGEKFIEATFRVAGTPTKQRLYKTGDRGRWLNNGEIQYLGRTDYQVKIRGYRIELGEIEHALSQIDGIAQSIVLVKERKTTSGITKYLVAYYKSDDNHQTLTSAAIIERLSLTLPEYMIPAALVAIESFPVNINGKLDQRALPEPDFNSSEEEYVAPVTEPETTICDIWQDALGLDRVGVTDNFFRIGGHSILAIQVSHRMARALNCDVNVGDIFKYKTISQLLTHSLGKARVIIPKSEADEAVLSFAQERLWFIEQYEQGSNAYHIPSVYELDSGTDADGIKYALQKIVSRHEVLRSTIEPGNSQTHGIQRVHNEPIFIEDIALTDQEDYSVLIEEEMNRPFDLSSEYPIRVKFYYVHPTKSAVESAEHRTLLLIIFHHIASDGWSGDIFERELSAFYEAYINTDTHFSLPALQIQYKDYAVWQRSYLTGEILQKQLGYWKEKLSGLQPLELPTDFVRPGRIDYSGAGISFTVSDKTSIKLRGLAQRFGVTMNSVMSAGVSILLNKYTGQQDIITGSVIANRHHQQTEDLVGFFVNTQAKRILLNYTQSFEELIQQVHKEQEQDQLYQDVPFEKLVEELGIERDSSRHPIFQVMFGMHDFGSQADTVDEQISCLKPLEEEVPYEVEKFDLSINIIDSNQQLSGYISYVTALFKKDTIQRLADHYSYLLDQLAENPGQPYSKISLLNTIEYEQVIYGCNNTDKDYPKERTLHQWFQEQAAKSPDHSALIFEGQKLSYKALDEKSNQLARHIRKQYETRTGQQLAPETLIALHLDRSLEMMIAILAVLKAGGAYVPIDTQYPQERIDYLLKDTRAEIILCKWQPGESSKTILPQEKLINIDLSEKLYVTEDISPVVAGGEDTAHGGPLLAPSNTDENFGGNRGLAYVIYTSGTTGNPKGVMVEQGGVINLITDLLDKYNINPSERFLLFASYVFDASVEQMWLALLSGGELYIITDELITDTDKFEKYIVDNHITHLHATPSFLSLVNPLNLSTLKRVVFGAEYLSKSLFEKFKRVVPVVINEYGPTESTITSLCSINSNLLGNATIQNTKTYILDASQNPVPTGVTGELYIGGDGLARGYLNLPDLTNERFIKSSFHAEENKNNHDTRLYKTGDLVRRLQDGTLEYIGRNDEQVKIRGYRIEPGEIESALTQIAGISQSCVIARERKTESGTAKYLVAYYKLDSSGNMLTEVTILEKLSFVLPEYMIPGHLIRMESFLLTINGKIDKKALPNADFNPLEDEYVAPATETEIEICNIWQDLLGVEKVGTTDNFFRIGGDSILSIQVSGRIRQAGYNCRVKDIFECKTVGRLAEHLDKNNPELLLKSEQGILTGEVPLSPIQQWFVQKVKSGKFPLPNHWNNSFLIRVPELDLVKLESCIEKLIAYHDMLRVTFTKTPPESAGQEHLHWKQLYQQNISLPPLHTLDVSQCATEEIEEILTDWQSGFDLETGYLFQPGYLYGYEDGSARIFMAMHHIIVDGVSWRILTDNILTLYNGNTLPQKGSSYRQWVDVVSKYALQYPKEAFWWQKQLHGMPDIHLNQQNVSPSEDGFELDKSSTRFLLQTASKAYHTEINDLLLTALAYALKDVNQSDVQGITLEGHGREDIDALLDTSRTVGWFTSMFPVKLVLRNDIKESIRSIKERLRRIPNKGIGFGVFATKDETSYSTKDLPPISFNYLGQFEAAEEDWQIVSEGSGISMHPKNEDHNLVNINGMVIGGKMMFSIETKLGEQTTNQICDSFKTHLKKIITHCKKSLDGEESSYTPGDFSSVRISQALLDRLVAKAKFDANEIVQIYDATSLQQGFIYHALSQQEDDAYRIQLLMDYHVELDVEKYMQAWKLCVARYPILRTAFNWEEDIVQVIYKHGRMECKMHDIQHLATQQQKDAAVSAIQIEDRKQSFDLTKPTLFRLHIIKHAEAHYTILKSEHHSISDGWSWPVLLASLHQYYEALIEGKKVEVTEDTAWLSAQEYIHAHKHKVQEYWSKTFAGVSSANDINALLSSPINMSSYREVTSPAKNILEFKGDFCNSLKAFSKREGITINVIVQFAWHKLLQVYSGVAQSIVGTTVSGRDLPIDGIEESVGLYINTLPLLIDWGNHSTIRSQLSQVQQKITALNTYSFADLTKLQIEGERIFHSLLVYENYPVPKGGEEDTGISFRDSIEKIDYPLSLVAFGYNDALTLSLDYDREHLTETKAQQHLATLEIIIRQVVEDPGKSHNSISLFKAREYNQIIYGWNPPGSYYSRDVTICKLFEEQVTKFPDNVALIFEEQQLTYRELNNKSNQLARHIRTKYKQQTERTLGPDTLVALYLDRSMEMLISILAVLKAGGAYVPIDINYPQQRIDYMVQDTRAKLILSTRLLNNGIENGLPQDKIVYVNLQEPFYKTEETANLPEHSKPNHLAYVIYTSGTTGKPKGVMVEHHNVVKFVMENNYINCEEVAVVAALANYAFDGSIFDIFFSLLNGKQLVLMGNSYLSDTSILDNYFSKYNVDTVFIPTALFHTLVQNQSQCLKNLKHITIGGEACNREIINKFKQQHKQISLVNAYGPTENAVYSLCCNLSNYNTENVVPIGKPLCDKYVYVLDENRSPVPIGVTAELYIGGPGIARGYLNNPELTKERFIINPFATEADNSKGYSNMYRTGDQVRWLPCGNMEFMGRKDEQVKIRGYRIELEEIEYALTLITGIRESCVLARERTKSEGSPKYLVGYYVTDDSNGLLTETMIRNKLSQSLPGFMIPDTLIAMKSFPVTGNGKLDKTLLPDPGFYAPVGDYVAPVTETEIAVCTIWGDVLGLERVGVTDNFFRIGGNSILAIQASHRMSRKLGTDVKVADIFKSKTIQILLNNSTAKQLDPENVEWDISINTNNVKYIDLVKAYHFSQNKNLDNLIFIHPGHGGSEVYQHLADLLSVNYNCIGIDNYNIHHIDKISSLNELASCYLSAYEKKYVIGEPINLIGWSLGGQIALEMASILEGKGINNINVFLLDTFIRDIGMASLQKEIWDELLRKLIVRGNFEQTYIDMITAASEAERELANSSISDNLQFAQVTLFKATKSEEVNGNRKPGTKGLDVERLKKNFIDAVAKNLEVIDLICHHEDILDTNSETIANYLLYKNSADIRKRTW